VQHPETLCRATEHIPHMVKLIQKLAAAALPIRPRTELVLPAVCVPCVRQAEQERSERHGRRARVDVDEYEKDSARDFALWKSAAWRDFLETEIGTDVRLAHRMFGDGDGVPGRELRHSLRRRRPDVPAPRERDCASESATKKTFARLWMHVRFLLVEGRKMSKSEGNFFTRATCC